MTQFQPDWPGQPLPQDRPVRASDLADAKFSVAFRGYRMAEVDEALDRLAAEIAQRDERIQQLTGQPFDGAPPVAATAGDPYEPAAYQPAEHQPAEHQPAEYQPAEYQSAAYQPAAYQPAPYQPAPYQPAPYQPGAYDTAVYPPVAESTPPAAYEPHGYPPGVLDLGGHPTQPIPPVTDPSTES